MLLVYLSSEYREPEHLEMSFFDQIQICVEDISKIVGDEKPL